MEEWTENLVRLATLRKEGEYPPLFMDPRHGKSFLLCIIPESRLSCYLYLGVHISNFDGS